MHAEYLTLTVMQPGVRNFHANHHHRHNLGR